MNRKFSLLMAATIASIAGFAVAQPTLTSLGGGVPIGVTNQIGGTYYIGGAGAAGTATASRWTLTGATLTGIEIGGTGGGGLISSDGLFQTGQWLNTGPQIFGNTGTSTGHNPNLTLIPSTTLPAANEFAARRWSSATNSWTSMGGLPIVPSLLAFGSSSGGGSGSNFLSANSISSTGRFTVGLGYVCTYNNAGTTVSANTFRWRPWIWDADSGIMKILPTPLKTTAGQTALRRTGNAYAVSSDGLVIAGAQEHNSATSPSADPDGGRLVVWRWNASISDYEMTFLPNGVNASGFPYTYSTTPSSLDMNEAGTIIVCRAVDDNGNGFIGKWTWNSGTSSWDGPVNLGSNLATQASWLPGSVLSCGVPPNIGGSLAMSDDGNIVVGSAVYSTCGSFMTGGFIWTAADGIIEDWYDYNVAAGTPGCTPGGFFGPIGDNGDPTRGLPVLGNPTAISPDGSAIVGFQGGTQRIVGAPPWIWRASGGPACVAPTITLNPAATTNYSACSSSIILNVAASGTPPFTYQWYRDGSPISDGTQGDGSTVTGATSFQLRINAPLSADDVGTYYAVVTGSCGSPAQSTSSIVQTDPAFPAGSALNDTCATAQPVVEGTNVLGSGQSPCSAYANDPNNSASCLTTGTLKTDRWFSFTPSTTGNYRIETCGSNYDTVLSVFDNCGGGELACNNDLNIGPSTGCSASRSRVGSITLQANQAYLIRIAAPVNAFLSGTNVMNLSISTAPAPAANDTCENATVAVLGANPFNTTEATNDYIAICNTSASRDVWFTYTPTGYGKLVAKTCVTPSSGTYNTVLTVFDGCGGTEIGCNDDSGVSGCSSQSIVSDLSVGPTPYYFRLAGSSVTNFGAGVLTLEFICFADFNQDGGVTGEDVEAFFVLYEAGSVSADVNLDGGVTGDDVQTFFELFEAGGC